MRSFVLSIFMVMFLTAPLSLRAEPGPVIGWLMNEPVSLLDIGLYRLEKDVQSLRQGIEAGVSNGARIVIGVHYSWDKNRIYVLFAHIEELKRDDCEYIIGITRLLARVNPTNGTPLVGDSSNFSSFFSHFGYSKKSQPKEYRKKLDHIFEIVVNAKNIKCMAPLLGSGFSVEGNN